jgi:peroxiredoxin
MNRQHRGRAALVALGLGVAGVLGVSLMGLSPSARAGAQAASAKAEIGKPFQNFTLTNIASEKKEKISLASFKGKKAVVGIFMANQCGTTWRYEAKIGQLIKDYGKKGVAVLAIHTNYNETDAEIVGQVESRNLAMPVLDDKKTQALGRYVGARVTPTFFVIDKAGILRYVGSFDDRGAAPAYVPDALNAIAAAKPVSKTQTRPFG